MKKTCRIPIGDGLNLRERLFCLHYLIEKGNGAAAAKAAGYTGDLARRASMLLANPKVAAVIQREGAKLVAKLEVKAERVLQGVAKVAFADIRKMFRPDNTMIPVALLDEDSATLISGVIFRKGGLRVNFYRRLDALNLLGQHLGLWNGVGDNAGDRLHEILAAFKEGAVEVSSSKKDKEPTIQ